MTCCVKWSSHRDKREIIGDRPMTLNIGGQAGGGENRPFVDLRATRLPHNITAP